MKWRKFTELEVAEMVDLILKGKIPKLLSQLDERVSWTLWGVQRRTLEARLVTLSVAGQGVHAGRFMRNLAKLYEPRLAAVVMVGRLGLLLVAIAGLVGGCAYLFGWMHGE
ncbi:MAG: hypothetical protein AAFV29_17465 [Myxococcota bacterium]